MISDETYRMLEQQKTELESLRQENSRLREALTKIYDKGEFYGGSGPAWKQCRIHQRLAKAALNQPKS